MNYGYKIIYGHRVLICVVDGLKSLLVVTTTEDRFPGIVSPAFWLPMIFTEKIHCIYNYSCLARVRGDTLGLKDKELPTIQGWEERDSLDYNI